MFLSSVSRVKSHLIILGTQEAVCMVHIYIMYQGCTPRRAGKRSAPPRPMKINKTSGAQQDKVDFNPLKFQGNYKEVSKSNSGNQKIDKPDLEKS